MKATSLFSPSNLDTLARACAMFSGVVHLGLVGRHFEEAPVTGILFAIAGLGQLVAVFVGYRVKVRGWLPLQLAFTGGMVALWAATRFWAVPLIHGSPEPIDALGLETKASELVLMACLVGLWVTSRRPASGRPPPTTISRQQTH